MSVLIERRTFNTAEYYRMVEAGILSEDDHTELIEGEVIRMSPIGSRHAACVDRLNTLLHGRVGQAAIIRVQNPLHLNDFSEPQPDVALLKPRADFYSGAHPGADDVLLIVEVADSSVGYDRAVKVPLYARAGIPEVWLVDLVRNEIEIYRQPAAGSYAELTRAGRGREFASAQIPSLTLRADDILI
ncbi:MAG TPA: Uma2 family endonuclease [Pyrinomonadaceae bacterium]|jgi:Uma2 family endonuclease|nr:Uma2 family endonuclease [Pyrinomonadaceae bacterium]